MRISDSALVDAAELSNRYIADRFLPDKAIDVIDESAAKLKMEMTSKPLALDEIDRKVGPAASLLPPLLLQASAQRFLTCIPLYCCPTPVTTAFHSCDVFVCDDVCRGQPHSFLSGCRSVLYPKEY